MCKIADYAHEKYKKAQVGKERAKAKVCDNGPTHTSDPPAFFLYLRPDVMV